MKDNGDENGDIRTGCIIATLCFLRSCRIFAKSSAFMMPDAQGQFPLSGTINLVVKKYTFACALAVQWINRHRGRYGWAPRCRQSRVSSESAICNVHVVIGSCMSRAAKCSDGREKGQQLVKLALASRSTMRRVQHWILWTAITCRYV